MEAPAPYYVSIGNLRPYPGVYPSNARLRGTVALVWPYSSSKDSLSILVAEPDVRLRRNKGQVRITFIGPSARAVARAELLNGDEVVLGLTGVEWAPAGVDSRISGESLDWELFYRERLLLQVRISLCYTAYLILIKIRYRGAHVNHF